MVTQHDLLPASPATSLSFPVAPLEDWLQLLHVTGMANGVRQRLLQIFGTPANILNASATQLQHAGLESSLIQAIGDSHDSGSDASRRTERTLQWRAEKEDRHLVLITDTSYPPLLREIADPPPLLYVQGNPLALLRPMVAIVGSRNCSQYGLSMARQLGAGLAKAGLVVSSGLAHGIDACAHRAAVDAEGTTVAVLGNGLSSIYPAGHRALAERIVSGSSERAGALVSELTPDAGPHASHFPRRNRIISGMSLGVCVVEAVMRSGSLITARMALEQNREVFAVPGSVNNTRSRGCHRLIRDGALLVENASDVISHLEPMLEGQLELLQAEADRQDTQESDATDTALDSELERQVRALLSDDPITPDAMLQSLHCTAAELSEALLVLELECLATRQGGRWVRAR